MRDNNRSECWPTAAVTLKPGAQATPQESRDWSSSGSRPMSTPAISGWSTSCRRARQARSLSARSFPRRTCHDDRHQRPGRGRRGRRRAGHAAHPGRARTHAAVLPRQVEPAVRWRSGPPPAPGSHPGRRAGRRAGPHRARRVAGRALERGPALRRPGLDAEPGDSPGHAGLSRRRSDRRRTRAGRSDGLAGRRAGQLRRVQPPPSPLAEQQPAAEPGGVEDADRYRRRQRRNRATSACQGPGQPAAGAVHGGRRRLPGGTGPRGNARRWFSARPCWSLFSTGRRPRPSASCRC